MRAKRWLFLYDGLRIVDTEANLGADKTITALFSLSGKGAGVAIGSTTKTATAVTGSYTITYTRTELQTALASLNGQTVFLHLDDGAVTRDVWPFVVSDEDPDNLPSFPPGA
jgi:hypothetical protein